MYILWAIASLASFVALVVSLAQWHQVAAEQRSHYVVPR